MRLLFDENLSHRLTELLQDLYPESLHVRDVSLSSSGDAEVWQYAQEHDLAIVSKDSDFRQLSFTLGYPPKVVWIQIGNCSTAEIEGILREQHSSLLAFESDEGGAFLALG